MSKFKETTAMKLMYGEKGKEQKINTQGTFNETKDSQNVFLNQKVKVHTKEEQSNREQKGMFLGGKVQKQIQDEVQLDEDESWLQDSAEYHHYFEKFDENYSIRVDELSYKDKFFSELTYGYNDKGIEVSPVYTNLVCWFYSLLFGIIFLLLALDVQSITINYGDKCQNNVVCNITFSLPTHFYSPLFIYYELENFYQIHPDFALSMSPKQMRGLDISDEEYDYYCQGYQSLAEVGQGNRIKSSAGYVMDFKQKANPCGVAAKYYFNDTFLIYQLPITNYSLIAVNQTSISFGPDNQYKYRKHQYFQFRQWLDVENELTMNWFNIQSNPKITKLWGRIETDLDQGDYNLIVYNNFPQSIFSGNKTLVITTLSTFGGKNFDFAIFMLVVSSIYGLSGIVLLVKYCIVRSKHLKIKQNNQKKSKLM